MADLQHVPVSDSYRCLDAGATSIYTLLDCAEVSSSGRVVAAHGSPDRLNVLSDDGTVADLEFDLPVGSKFTFQVRFNTASLPADLNNPAANRFFLGVYRTGGKCFGVLVSMQGVALVDRAVAPEQVIDGGDAWSGSSSEVIDGGDAWSGSSGEVINGGDAWGSPGVPGGGALSSSGVVPIPGTAGIQACVGHDTTLCLTVDENNVATLSYSTESIGESGILFTALAPDTPDGYGNGAVLEFVGQAVTPLSLSIFDVQADCYRVVPIIPVEYPLAVPGPDRTDLLGEPTLLDASASLAFRDRPNSTDANLRYQWSLVLAPDGSRFKIYDYSGHAIDDEDGDPFTPVFSALPGASLFSAANAPLLKPGDTLVLSARDAQGVMQSYAYTVSPTRWAQMDGAWVRNYAGGWNDDQLVVDGDTIPITWSNTAWTVNHTATFIYEPQAQVTYAAPDVAGLFEVQLVVSTAPPVSMSSAPVTMLVNVVPTALALGVVPDVTYLWSYLSNFWDLLDDKEKVATAWSGFAQAAANILLTAWQIDYNKSLKDIQRTFQRRWLPYSFKVADTSTDIRISRGPLFGDGFSLEPWPVGGQRLDLIIDGGPLVSLVFDSGDPDPLMGTEAIVEQINAALVAAGYPEMASVRIGATGQVMPQIVHTGLVQALIGDPSSSAAVTLQWGRRHPNTLAFENPQNEVWGDGYVWVWTTDSTVMGKLTYVGWWARDVERLQDVVLPGSMVVFEASMRSVFDSSLRVLSTDFYGSPTGWRNFAATCISYEEDPYVHTNLCMRITQELPPASLGLWFVPSVVVSKTVDFYAAGVLRSDLAVFSVRDLSTGGVVDIHCPVHIAHGKQLAFDPRPLLIKWNGYRDNYETIFTGVLRTQSIPVDDLVVSVPRLQADVLNPRDVLEEGKDYSVKRIEQNGVSVNAIVLRNGTFAAQDPPVDSYWAEQTHLDNSPAIEANFGSLVPPLSEKSFTEWKKDLPNLDYLSAVQGLWYAYWGGPSVFRMRVGVQILLGLPFAEEAGTVVEVNDLFSTKEGRLLIQDKNSTLVRSYFYPRSVGPTQFKVGDVVERFAPLCGGVEILDWVNSPSWGSGFTANNTISGLQKYFRFMLRGNADAFDPLHIMFAADFVRHVKPHYTNVMTVLQKDLSDDIEVVDLVATTVKLKVVQSIDPLVRGVLRWDDYDGAGRIRHHLDEAPISFVWDHDGLCPRQQVSILSSTLPTDLIALAGLQALGASQDVTTVLRVLPGSGTLTRVVVIVRAPVRGPSAADYASIDLLAQPSTSIVTGVPLSQSQGTYTALDLSGLTTPCTGQGFAVTWRARTFTWNLTTAGSVQFYYFIS